MTGSTDTIELPDLKAMDAFGARIAKSLRPGDVVSLAGELGAGKTTLARAVIKALGYRGEVPSPTFTIIEVYDASQLDLSLVHADFYRLESPAEVEELGLENYRENAALLAEWPEKAGGFTHEPGCLAITLEPADDGRRAIVEGGADWLERMP